MAIKNYTTEVDVYKSLGEIQAALATHGARKIMVDYDEAGQPTGVMFGLETPAGPRGFCLPANVDGVKAVFVRQKIKQKRVRQSVLRGGISGTGYWLRWPLSRRGRLTLKKYSSLI